MRASRKAMLTGVAAASAAMGYMAAKKQYENKNSFHKILSKIEDYLDH